jgi:hypothetical protein
LQTHRVLSPIEASNVRELRGETLMRHMQYPSTILKFMKDRQVSMFDNFIKYLDKCVSAEKMLGLIRGQHIKYESESGCLRKFYRSELRDEGQPRYEAADDMSFDICGSFCPNCEISRRLCELLPVHYSVPEENEEIEAPMDGFTSKTWVTYSEPDDTHIDLNDEDPRIRYWTLSPTLFRDLLAMVCSAGLSGEILNDLVHSYGCGGMRYYVVEAPSDLFRETRSSIDIAHNILKQLSHLEKTHVYKNVCKVNIFASEISPFVRENAVNHVYYDGRGDIHLDVRSSVIHGMSLRITNQMGFQNVFICPEVNDEISMTFVKSITEHVPDRFMHPRIYYNVPGMSVLLMMVILYLSSSAASELAVMVNTDPDFLTKLGIFLTNDSEQGLVRKAMIEAKLDRDFETYEEMVIMCRNILQGLSI